MPKLESVEKAIKQLAQGHTTAMEKLSQSVNELQTTTTNTTTNHKALETQIKNIDRTVSDGFKNISTQTKQLEAQLETIKEQLQQYHQQQTKMMQHMKELESNKKKGDDKGKGVMSDAIDAYIQNCEKNFKTMIHSFKQIMEQ